MSNYISKYSAHNYFQILILKVSNFDNGHHCFFIQRKEIPNTKLKTFGQTIPGFTKTLLIKSIVYYNMFLFFSFLANLKNIYQTTYCFRLSVMFITICDSAL